MSKQYFSGWDDKTIMADVDVNGNSLELTIEDEKVKAIGNIPVGGGDESVWTEETYNALSDDNDDEILDENNEPIGGEDSETLWATRDGIGFKAERAEADINGNSLELHVNAEGKIDKIGDKYIEGTGEAPVDAYSKEETNALLDDKVDKVSGKGLSANDYTDADKGKLDNIESGAEVNLIESVKVDGSALTIDATKAVDIPLASATASGNETVYVTGVVTGQDKQKWDDWTSASVDIPPINGVKIGGRKYEVKKFGDRVWMMESLKYDTEVPNALYINESQGVYYYTGDYLLRGDELATIIPAGWRVPTISDRDALVALAGGTNEDGARYLFNNFNVERSTFYDGYHSYPGGYLSDWQFCVATDGNGPVGAILIRNTTTPTLVNSNNSGGGGYDARFPVRLCRDAIQGE